MKASEFRQLIREEVKKVLKEADQSTLHVKVSLQDINPGRSSYVTFVQNPSVDKNENYMYGILDLDKLSEFIKSKRVYLSSSDKLYNSKRTQNKWLELHDSNFEMPIYPDKSTTYQDLLNGVSSIKQSIGQYYDID